MSRSFSPVASQNAPTPAGPYSQATVANGLIFVSGQRPSRHDDGQIPDGVTAQTRQVLSNLRSVIEAAGASLTDVVRVNVYLDDISHFDSMNAVYCEFFTAPFPARTTVACSLRGILVEIDAVAVSPR